MDPKACFMRLLDAMSSGERDEVLDALQDLTEWLRKGGALPEVRKGSLPEVKVDKDLMSYTLQ